MISETANKNTSVPSLIKEPGKLNPIYKFVADVSFFLFLFFAFFGTSMPFRERSYDVDQIGSTNVINQIVFSSLFLSSLFAILPKWKQIFDFIKKEQLLTIFIIWCSLSILWSDYHFIAFKRLFQFYAILIICLAVLIHHDSLMDIQIHFKILLSIYLVLSIISVIFIPGAADPTSYSWRGLTPSKNLLGQSALIGIIFWFNATRHGSLFNKLISILMLMISLILLIGSRSMTSLLVLFIILIFALLFKFEKLYLYKLGIGYSYSIILIIAVGVTFFVTYYAAPELITALPQSLGKDTTFTGRTELWKDIFSEANQHFILGCGFRSFWGINNINLFYLYQKYVWLPNQAHMGYLDILNELGIIGLAIFIIMIIKYFKNYLKLIKPQFWLWYFVAALLINLQETTLFSPKHPSGILFIFAYLALFYELIQQDNQQKISEQAEMNIKLSA